MYTVENIEMIERIVDYVISLESLFLIDNKMYFLRRTLAERVSRFLNDNSLKDTIKFMYDQRSDIVHGNYINLKDAEQSETTKKIKKHMQIFESLVRRVFVKLFDFDFSKKEEIVNHMENLYDVPTNCLQLMTSVQKKANKCIKNLQKN